jgi:hypothetical protein
MGVAALVGCGAPADDEIEPMDPVQLLTRVSLDTRGIRPSVAEIERVEADAGELSVIRAEYLAGPRFVVRRLRRRRDRLPGPARVGR